MQEPSKHAMEAAKELCPYTSDTEFIGTVATIIDRAIQEATKPLVEALTEIACFGDEGANNRLAATGSYGLFDAPQDVRIAREALRQVEGH